MTPVGHAAVSALTARWIPRLSLVGLLLGAWAPDVDYLFVGFSWFTAIHRLVTHNLLFAAAAGLAAGLGAKALAKRRDGGSGGREGEGDAVGVGVVGTSVALGVLLHLLVDSVLDNNPSNGLGVAWLWPLTDAAWGPFQLLDPAGVEEGWADPLAMAGQMGSVILLEVPFWIGAVLVWRGRLFQARPSPRSDRGGASPDRPWDDVPMGQLEPGDLAPDFTATDTEGNGLVLSDLVAESVVLLAFFPKAFTPG